MTNEEELIAWFRASTSYINAHRGKTFVIHLGGDVLAHHNVSGIIHDLTLLHSLGVKLVLVHGARPQISAALAETGQTSVYENGLRITEADHMETIKSTVGKLSIDLQASFSMRLSKSPMYGANISYSMYLFHVFFIHLTQNLFQNILFSLISLFIELKS